MNPTSIVAYLTLFAAVAFLFLFVALLLGWFLRAYLPTPEKLQPYECGEPPIGSSFIQFDLRFYVVALVFIVFEAEVAFFFPWAMVFGTAAQLMKPGAPGKEVRQQFEALGVGPSDVQQPAATGDESAQSTLTPARQLALAAMVDMAVFFAVLLVGFAYVWYRGDLDWVRAVGRPPTGTSASGDEAAFVLSV